MSPAHRPTVSFLPKTNLQTDYHHSVAISLLRGLAAVQVAAAHMRNLYYPGLSTLSDPSAGYRVLAFLTGFAHQAVVVFFVLSGWLVGGSLLNRLGEPKALQSYAIDRITRLWIVLIPAFAVSLLVGIAVGTADPSRPDLVSAGAFSLPSFAANLFGLQDLAFPSYGLNFALWSLAYEIWYYVLFPLAVLMFAASASATRAVAAVALAVIAYHLTSAILLYFILWLMGAGFSRLQIRLAGLSRWAFAGAFLAVAVWFRLTGSNDTFFDTSFLQDLLYSLLFLILLCSLQTPVDPASGSMRRLERFGRFFADFSFSLYVIHVPLLYLVRPVLEGIAGRSRLDPSSLADFGIYTALVVLVVVLAWLFHLPFEAQTYRVRRRLKELMLVRPRTGNIT